MAKSFLQNGKILEITAGAALSDGVPFALGNLLAMPLSDIANGAKGNVSIAGVHQVPKSTGEAWAVGDKLGWDVSLAVVDKTFTPAAGDVTNAGVAAVAAASGDTVGYMLLTPGVGTLN